MLFTTTRRLVSLLLLIVGFSARSQELKIPDTPEVLNIAPPPSDRFPAKWYPRVGDGTDVVPAPVTDRPYTAMEGPILPSSGEMLRHESMTSKARDRFGRTRIDAETGGFTLDGRQHIKTKTVLVSDPVSHCEFNWTQPTTDVEMPSDMRVAMVKCGPQTLRYKEIDLLEIVVKAMPEGISQNGDITEETEKLTPVMMNGLTIRRIRVSTSRLEHGELKKSSTETWYSPELREFVRRGSPESSYTGLIDIQLKDPDPTLFYPPKGYRIELQTPATRR